MQFTRVFVRRLLVLILPSLLSVHGLMLSGAEPFGHVSVPDLIGRTAKDVSSEIAASGLVLKLHLGKGARTEAEAFTAYEQDPKAGASVAKGSEVHVTIYGQSVTATAESTTNVEGKADIEKTVSGEAPGSGETSRVRTITRQVTDHDLAPPNRLTATDLEHGAGAGVLFVKRVWYGGKTRNVHFGSGWADPNSVQLTSWDADKLIIWAGGITWRTAHRGDDGFEAWNGEKIHETNDGWVFSDPHNRTLTFDAKGRLTSVKLPFGQIIRYVYDSRGRLMTVEQNGENFLRYHYLEEEERATRIEGPEGLQVDYEYDDRGRLAAVVNSRRLRVEYQYDDDNALVAARDQFGNVFEVPAQRQPSSADGVDELAGTESDTGTSLAAIQYEYNQRGLIEKEHDQGQTTRLAYDDAGQLAAATSPEGTESYKYDAFGRPVSVTTPDGEVYRYQYNRLDLPTRIDCSDGTWTTFEYNELGLLVRRRLSSGEWYEADYDANGRLVVTRSSPGLERRLFYDDQDRLIRVSDSQGRRVSYEYDQRGNRTSAISPTGESKGWEYGALGRLARSTSSTGLQTNYGYQGDRLLWDSQTDNLHGRTVYGSSDGKSFVDRQGVGKWQVATGARGQVTSVVSPLGQEWFYAYSSVGKPSLVATPSGQSYHYEHDGAGRLTGFSLPSGLETTYARDEKGRITHIVRGGTPWREYEYDDKGRVRLERTPLGVAAEYAYDENGRLHRQTLPEGDVALTYDPSGLVVSINGPDYRIDQQFHPDGELAQRSYEPAGLELQLPVDQFGRSAGIAISGAWVTYGYGANGLLGWIELPNGQRIDIAADVGGRPTMFSYTGGLKVSVRYSRVGRIEAISAESASGPVFSETYEHDAVGNLRSMTDATGTAKFFDYDPDDRLTKITAAAESVDFGYDQDGNLRSVSAGPQKFEWELDRAGRPKRLGTRAFYTWDNAGNLAGVESAGFHAENAFDAAGRLVRRRVGQYKWQCGYLPDGDRLWQQGPSGKVWYAYLPEGLVGWKDALGVIWLVVTLPGTDWPLAICGSNGATYFIVADRLRSIRRVVEISGRVAARDDYGPSGQPLVSEGYSPLASYAGMLCDEHGLHYARKRYYDPGIARFISMDPWLGSIASPSSLGLYDYAAGNPLRFRDPLGAGSFEDDIGYWIKHAEDVADARNPQSRHLLGTTHVSDYLTPDEHAQVKRLYDELDETGGKIKNTQGLQGNLRGYRDARQRQRQITNSLNNLNDRARARRLLQIQSEAVDSPALSPDAKRRARGQLDDLRRRLTELGGDSPSGGGTAKIKVPARGTKKSPSTTRRLTAKVVKETGEEVSEGIIRRLVRRVTGLLGAGVGLLFLADDVRGAANDVVSIGTAVVEGKGARDAEQEAKGNEQELDETVDDLINDLKDIFENDPGQIIAQDNDGRPLDGDQPNDWDTVRGQAIDNVNQGRNPFDGIVNRPRPGGAPPVTVPNAPRGNQNRIALARRLLQQGMQIEQAMERSIREAQRLEDEAQVLAQRAQASDPPGNFDDLKEAIEDVNRRIAEVKKRSEEKKEREDDTWKEASEIAEKNRKTICGYAKQCEGSEKPSKSQAAAWRKEASKLISETSKAIDKATEDEKGDESEEDTDAADELRTAIRKLDGLTKSLDDLTSDEDDGDIISQAKKLLADAGRLRAPLSTVVGQLNTIRGQVVFLVSPFVWYDQESRMLRWLADDLGAGLQAATPASVAAVQQQIAEVEQRRGEIPDDSQAQLEAARDAIQQGETLLDEIKPPDEESSDDEAADDENVDVSVGSYSRRALRDLQHSLECYRKIKGKDEEDEDEEKEPESKPPARSPGILADPIFNDGPPLRGDDIPGPSNQPFTEGLFRALTPSVASVRIRDIHQRPRAPDAPSVPLHPFSTLPPSTGKPSRVVPPSGDTVTVPLVRGLKVQEAKQRIEQAGLALDPVLGTGAPDEKQHLVVYAQQPEAGATVAARERVRVTFYDKPASSSGLMAVPDVAGLPAAEASKQVKDAGFMPKFQYGESAPSPEKSFHVYSQSPRPGTRSLAGSTVEVKIYAEYKTPSVLVPNVSGLAAAEASQRVKDAGLTPDFTYGKTAPTTGQAYRAYQQSPHAAARADKGTVVRITLYGKAKPPMVASRPPVTRTPPKTHTPTTRPKPHVKTPTSYRTLTGRWKCSCGEVWMLRQTGNKVTAQESVSGRIRNASGTFDGKLFRFTWSDTGGNSGSGVMVPNPGLTRMNWRMTLRSTGQSWDGSVSRIQAN
ncbi:MAG: PASTA domain-containing protein [Planctomycetes bacterium]|nr:PASTA domain-containing protein [Planctomycetota bacterium]MBL7038784.1 PASTA domain-containing protein [Pirellulaceae bacterium]